MFTLLDFVTLSFIHNGDCGALAEDLVSFGLDFDIWHFRRILVDLGSFIFRYVWCRFFSIFAKMCELVLIIDVDNGCINQISFINATNLLLLYLSLFLLTLVLKLHQFLMCALSIELVHVLSDPFTDQGWVVCLHRLVGWSLLVQSSPHLFAGISAVLQALKLRHFRAFA